MQDYELVVIDKYIDNILNEKANSYMGKLWKFKKDMYTSAHGQLTNIIDIDDFYCTHIVFVDKVSARILMAFKYIDYDVCTQNGINFPLLKYASLNSNELQGDIYKYICEIKRSGGRISYSGGWCVDNEITCSKVKLQLMQAYIGIHYLEQVNNGFDFITGIGVKEVGTINFFNKKFHAKPIVNKLVELSSIERVHGCFLSTSISQLSILGSKNIEKYRSVWDFRTKIC